MHLSKEVFRKAPLDMLKQLLQLMTRSVRGGEGRCVCVWGGGATALGMLKQLRQLMTGLGGDREGWVGGARGVSQTPRRRLQRGGRVMSTTCDFHNLAYFPTTHTHFQGALGHERACTRRPG